MQRRLHVARRGVGTGDQGNDERGFALALSVLVAMVLLMLIGALLYPVTTDTLTAMRATSLVENRTMADSVLNELFSEVRLDTRAVPEPVLLGRVAPGKTVSDAGLLGGWATWNQTTNAAEKCPNIKSTCYYYAVAAPATPSGATGDYVVAEVTVRTRCQFAKTCVYRRYQQRWHRRRFLDYVLFTDLETLSPTLYPAPEKATIDPTTNCVKHAGDGELADPGHTIRARTCNEVIFSSPGATRNEVNGPIHTNDPQFWMCGSPRFTGLVEAASVNPLKTFVSGCPTAVPDVVTDLVKKGPILPLPDSVTKFADITPLGNRFAGNTKVVLAGDKMTVTRADGTTGLTPVPARGLLYVAGDLTVEGNANGVTLVSSGTIHISGDLTGFDVGLVADGDVVIAYSPTVRTVEASVLSRSGTIYNDGLRTAPTGAEPKLNFTGAMVSKFHPVSGLFDSKSGNLVSGMVSVMSYPSPAPNPPYFLEPVQAAWERVDFTEIPLGAATPTPSSGLTGVPNHSATGPIAGCSLSSPVAAPYLVACLAP